MAHRFVNDGAGCCAVCEDTPGYGEHADLSPQQAYAHPWGEEDR